MVLEELRKAGLKVEPHQARFRHNTPDIEWLAVVGEKKWVVLMRDQNIGRRPLELEVLLQAGVRSFVLVEGQLPDRENAKILTKAIPRMFELIREHPFPFIARVRRDSSVVLWKTQDSRLATRREKQTKVKGVYGNPNLRQIHRACAILLSIRMASDLRSSTSRRLSLLALMKMTNSWFCQAELSRSIRIAPAGLTID